MSDGTLLTEDEYYDALSEASVLVDLDPYPGTPEGDRLVLLVDKIQAYEALHDPLPPLDPIEARKIRRDQQ